MYWIVMLSLMVIWFIICTVRMIIKSKKAIREKNVGVVYHVKCEGCEFERESDYDELMKTKFAKTKSESVSVKVGGVAGGKVTNVRYFAKKCKCPNCGKKTWHQVLDYYENAKMNTAAILPNVAIWFVSLFIFAMAGVKTTVLYNALC